MPGVVWTTVVQERGGDSTHHGGRRCEMKWNHIQEVRKRGIQHESSVFGLSNRKKGAIRCKDEQGCKRI